MHSTGAMRCSAHFSTRGPRPMSACRSRSPIAAAKCWASRYRSMAEYAWRSEETPATVLRSFLGVAPDLCRLLGCLVDRPLRQRDPVRHVAEHHADASADTDPLDHVGRGELPVGGAEIANDAQCFVGSRLALLRIEIDQQHHVGGLGATRRLNRVLHLCIGMHRAFSLDFLPDRLARHAPRAGGRRRIAQPVALGAGLQVEIMRGAMLEILDILDIEIVDAQPHAEIVSFDWHDLFPFHQPLRMTIDDAVAGLAQPRLALTSTFLTWRQPPSR